MAAEPELAARASDFEFAALGEARNYRAALLREFAPHLHGRVLEAGAGIGQFTALLRQLPGVQRLVALEPEPRFCRQLRDTFPGLAVLDGTIDIAAADPAWDAVVSINVLEHIADDRGELAAYARLLAPQRGALCLFVPAGPELYAPIDRDFGHFRRYTRPDLRKKLEQAGFAVLRLEAFNSVGYAVWWFGFRVLRRRRFTAWGVRWFDRWVFPPVRALETRLGWVPFGQSLLAVARAASL
jgi:SAM-dependent methyltransferase